MIFLTLVSQYPYIDAHVMIYIEQIMQNLLFVVF